MKRIKLTQGKCALVDDNDYVWLNCFKWYTHKDKYTCYAVRQGRTVNGKREFIRMHRVILGAPRDMEVDHVDGHGLNNQRDNLRICSRAENLRNARQRKVGVASVYKGVDWCRKNSKWRAQISADSKKMYLGYFFSEKAAAQAYDVAAMEYHGDFRLTNKMLGLL